MQIPRYEESNLTDSERDLLALVVERYAAPLTNEERDTLTVEVDKFASIVAGRAYIYGHSDKSRRFSSEDRREKPPRQANREDAAREDEASLSSSQFAEPEGEPANITPGDFSGLLARVLGKYAPSLPEPDHAALRGALDELYCVVAAGAYTHGREEWTDQPVTIP